MDQITGVAGTGKSAVTQKIVHDAKEMRKEIACAAPTGVAAVNLGPDLGAQTIHSLAGVGVPQAARDFARMLAIYNRKKWLKIEMLVLDEIGMLAADFLGTYATWWLDYSSSFCFQHCRCLPSYFNVELPFTFIPCFK
jgi:ATP-dependent exoDNAse (exonuclease V) alpha subunit